MTQRILHIIATLDRAGAEKQLALLARRLPRDRFDIHVCALTRGGPLREELTAAGIPVTVLNKRFKADPVSFARLVKLIRRLQPDLIHTWMFTANAYGRAAGQYAGVSRMIASERCVDPWKSGWQFAIDRRLARATNRIVANAPAVADFYTQHGLAPSKLRVIANGIEQPGPSRLLRGELLSRFDLPVDVPLIGAVGRFWPQKRMKYLIWSAELLHLLHPQAQLLIAGDGPQLAQAMRYCSLLDGDDYVHFLGQRNDVPDILPHLDLFWHVSGYEGLPNAVMEAMAAALPVVATDVAGNRDLIEHGETGMLVASNDRRELVRASDRLIGNAALREKIGRAAQAQVLETYAAEKMVCGYVKLYDEVLAE
ncbi:MAG: glycosyltransferase [Planctomycetales bacterium]|nr:glycosyltransferase [Planctomycetales bacterium]